MKLSIKAFRGVKDTFSIDFKARENLTVIYGENGSGKTTISDALEFVFFGTPGSLEEKSLDGKGKIPSLVHAQCEKSDLLVTWEDQNESLRATIDKTKANIVGNSTTKLHTLSRKNIASLIDETPAKRFGRIQEFVSLPNIESEEASLKQFIADQKQQQLSQVGAATQCEENLEALYIADTQGITEPPERKDWMKFILADSPETIEENKTILTDLSYEITRLGDGFRPLEASYTNATTSEKNLLKERENLAKIVADSAEDFTQALDTLQSAKNLFDNESVENCPVCDTPFSHVELKEKVTNKLSKLRVLSGQNAVTKKAETAFNSATSALVNQQQNYYSIIEKLKEVHLAASENELWKIPPLPSQLLIVKAVEKLNAKWFEVLTTQTSELKNLRAYVVDKLEAVEAQLQLQKQLRILLKQKRETSSEHGIYTQIISKAEKIAQILQTQRIEHANSTLTAVSDDFARLYQTIHPGEDLENIRLYLHPSKKGSAQFDGTLFGNESMTPVACLSESHLDTLGLCLFLTLQKKESPENSIIYLDDAIASVDEAHMERLYHMILDEAENFKHVIISSHYQPLRFKFRWGILTKKKVNFVELGKWTIDGGIAMAKGPNSEVALLRKYIEAGDDPNTIAAKSGVILEQALDFLTGIYHCRLPRHPGAEQRWTLADYKGGLQGNRKLMAALRCDHISLSTPDAEGKTKEIVDVSYGIADLLSPIFDLLQVRNAIGCHFKEIAGEFNEISEALALGNATLALVDALCDKDDELPSSDKDGMSWTNKGITTRRLYPLQAPQ